MSRTGKIPVAIPKGVTVAVSGSGISAKGPQGELSLQIPALLSVKADNTHVVVERADNGTTAKSLHGLTRKLIINMLEGVAKGYTKDLEIQGVGFKAVLQGSKMQLTLGFAEPVIYMIPVGVKTTVTPDGTGITVAGPDRQKVGDVAARIRGFFPAEPYKGKGIRYKGERVRRKVGKTVA